MSGIHKRRPKSAGGATRVHGLQWRILQLEEKLKLAEFKLGNAAAYDDAKRRRIVQLEAELADWRKLRDPDHLADQMLQGVPAQWTVPHAERFLVSIQVPAEAPDEE